MIDLSTNYLGLKLRNPLVASASPLCENLDNIRRMEDAGASMVVMHSLFEEQINLDSQYLDESLSFGEESYAEAMSYFPDLQDYKLGPDEYLEHIRRAKESVEIPIVGSLNGVSRGGWVKYAQRIQEAGADALELNVFYVSSNPEMTGADVEQLYIDILQNVKANVRIPVAVKLSPYFSSMANMAQRLDEAGADALVLFNRFYQPDLDVECLEIVPNLMLSNAFDMRLRLRWAAILHDLIKADLAVTGGVHAPVDAIKCMMAGAKVAMMTSALLRHGIRHLTTMLDGVIEWLDEHEYESIKQMQGSMSQHSVADPVALQRANYLHMLSSYAERTSGI